MIGYVTLGSNDIGRSAEFYDELLVVYGAKRVMEAEHFIAWSPGPGVPALTVITPADGNDASVGNGNMVALNLDTNEKVDALHAKAMELGGTDEGAPGPRGNGGFYAGYFRDVDGNKLCAFCFSKAS